MRIRTLMRCEDAQRRFHSSCERKTKARTSQASGMRDHTHTLKHSEEVKTYLPTDSTAEIRGEHSRDIV